MGEFAKIIVRSLISSSIKTYLGVPPPRNAEEFAASVASKAVAKKLVGDILNTNDARDSVSKKD